LLTAQAQNENISNILARGNIYLDDPSQTNDPRFLVATNKKFPLAYVMPSLISGSSADDIALKLHDVLNIAKE